MVLPENIHEEETDQLKLAPLKAAAQQMARVCPRRLHTLAFPEPSFAWSR